MFKSTRSVQCSVLMNNKVCSVARSTSSVQGVFSVHGVLGVFRECSVVSVQEY